MQLNFALQNDSNAVMTMAKVSADLADLGSKSTTINGNSWPSKAGESNAYSNSVKN